METATHATQEAVSADLRADPGNAATVYEPAPPARSDEASMVDPFIRRLVLDKSIDLDRLNAVRAMVKETEQDAQRKAFNVAMVAVKAAIPIIVKNAENTDSKAQYATLDKIGEGIDHVLAENGIYVSFYPLPATRENWVKVECVIGHTDGFERRVEVEVPFDSAGKNGTINKTPIHAWRSATTYARRTLYEMIFDVKSRKATPDDDGRAAGGAFMPTITTEQAAEIRQMLKGTKSNEAKFLDTYKVESIETLHPEQFEQAKGLLLQRAANMAKKAGEALNAG